MCDVENCSKAYTNSSHLQRHKKTKHAKCSAPILCPADGCGRELANKTSLKKHMYRWHDPKRSYPFMCGECQQGFYRKKQLQQHTYLHSGELPFRYLNINLILSFKLLYLSIMAFMNIYSRQIS